MVKHLQAAVKELKSGKYPSLHHFKPVISMPRPSSASSCASVSSDVFIKESDESIEDNKMVSSKES